MKIIHVHRPAFFHVEAQIEIHSHISMNNTKRAFQPPSSRGCVCRLMSIIVRRPTIIMWFLLLKVATMFTSLLELRIRSCKHCQAVVFDNSCCISFSVNLAYIFMISHYKWKITCLLHHLWGRSWHSSPLSYNGRIGYEQRALHCCWIPFLDGVLGYGSGGWKWLLSSHICCWLGCEDWLYILCYSMVYASGRLCA